MSSTLDKIKKYPSESKKRMIKDIMCDRKSLILLQGIETPFSDVEDFLKDKKIDWIARENLAGRVTESSFSDVEDFLKDKTIDVSVREAMARRIEGGNFGEKEITNILDGQTRKESQYSQEVNRYQLKELNAPSNFPVPEKRDLVLYCRENQGFYQKHFDKIALFLNAYIKGGYSGVWSNLKVVTRFGKITNVGGIHVEPYTQGRKFSAQASLFADTIHLSHGTPEITPGTHSIIGTAIFSDQKKRQALEEDDYTLVNLLYYDGENARKFKVNQGDLGFGFPVDISMEDICKELLRGLQASEEAILGKITTPDTVIEEMKGGLPSIL